MLLSLALLYLVRPWPNEYPPSCRRPPFWPVSSCYFDGGGDLHLVGQVVRVVERIEHVYELPGLVMEVFRMSGIEVSDGEEELG
jgi:hypothetical protein